MSAQAILVLGMHRSGTSATSGALGRLGIPLGANLVEPADDNPLGYFEHGPVVAAHEAFLESLGRTWADPRPLPAGAFDTPAAEACREQLSRSLREDFSGMPAWAVKDPRLSRLLPLWAPLWPALDARACALLVLRHPAEVAASLARRDGFPLELSCWLWIRHVLEALEATSDWPRALLRYDALVAEPEDRLREALDAVGVVLPGLDRALDGFVDAGMNHHRGVRREPRGVGAGLAFDLFDALAAARKAPDGAVLAGFRDRCDAVWATVADGVEAGLAPMARLLRDRASLRSDLLGARSALAAQVRWSESAVDEMTTLRARAEADRHAASQERDAHRLALEETVRVEAALRRDLDFAERLVHEREQERDAHRLALEETVRVEAALRRDLDFAERLVHEREQERDALAAARDALATERDALATERSLILGSRSWRWTAPLRRLTGFLGRTFR